ncbi:MAG: TetR family transcriptional regulator C-terminal domain-containing protein [Sphaerochaetaceae bacterium]|nr:TetR family transcriptional regulator C-terminal domain-containing protein [Sphaerochaetaceae bacterium]
MNTSGENNRSVRNTKKKLSEGLLEILKTKPLNQVSIKELTEKVDVNRGTFYFHYQDVYSMVKEMEDKFLLDFAVAMDALEHKSRDFLNILLKCLSDNMDLCSILLSANGDYAFVERMKDLVDEKCSRIWKDAIPSFDKDDMDMLNAFLIGGVMSALQVWVNDGGRLAADKMAICLNFLIFEGICPAIIKWQAANNG